MEAQALFSMGNYLPYTSPINNTKNHWVTKKCEYRRDTSWEENGYQQQWGLIGEDDGVKMFKTHSL